MRCMSHVPCVLHVLVNCTDYVCYVWYAWYSCYVQGVAAFRPPPWTCQTPENFFFLSAPASFFSHFSVIVCSKT